MKEEKFGGELQHGLGKEQEDSMKQRMWSLINKETGKIIKIGVEFDGGLTTAFVVGFNTKKDLLAAVPYPEDNEEIRRIDFEF